MKLAETPEIVTFPATHYVFVEKVGPFKDTAMAAWNELHRALNPVLPQLKKTGAMALFKMSPEMIYRAGYAFAEKPAKIPDGFKYEHVPAGKYSKYTLTGPYMNLPTAWGRVMELSPGQVQTRDGWYVENYANDPSQTPEDKLISELMIPTK